LFIWTLYFPWISFSKNSLLFFMSVNVYLIEYRQVPPFDILRYLLLYGWLFNTHQEIVVLIIVVIPKLMNKSYRFVSNSGKSNVTILSLFQALHRLIFVKHSFLSHEKSQSKWKNAIFSFILVIIIGFLVIAGSFFACTGWGGICWLFCCLR
jgi:hypothetical protein